MIFRNVLKEFICIFAFMFFIPTMPVKAAESYGHDNGNFSWSIINDAMTVESVNGDWKITIKNDIYTIEGEKIITPLPVYEDDEPSTDNENEWLIWYFEHPADKLVFKIKLCSRAPIVKDPCLSRITILEIGEEAEIIDNNTFMGVESLKTVYVYSKNVELDNSGIGYSYFEDDVLEDLTIYGYSGSTAEAYANENGFTFIALDEPAATTTQVTTSTTTTTTTTVITTADSSTSASTLTEELTTTDTQTTAVQTTTAVGTTMPTSATGAESIVTTEISTVPTTVTTPAVITTETGTKLPQTGYSIWYQSLVAVAMGMVGVGSAAIVRSGMFRKKESNSQ